MLLRAWPILDTVILYCMEANLFKKYEFLCDYVAAEDDKY